MARRKTTYAYQVPKKQTFDSSNLWSGHVTPTAARRKTTYAYQVPKKQNPTAARRAAKTAEIKAAQAAAAQREKERIAAAQKAAELAEKQRTARAKAQQQVVVAEVGDDMESLANKLGIDPIEMQKANADTAVVQAGAALNVPAPAVPPAVPPGVPPGVGTGAGVGSDLWEYLIQQGKEFIEMLTPQDESAGETFYKSQQVEPGEIGSSERTVEEAGKFGDILCKYLGICYGGRTPDEISGYAGVGQGAGAMIPYEAPIPKKEEQELWSGHVSNPLADYYPTEEQELWSGHVSNPLVGTQYEGLPKVPITTPTSGSWSGHGFTRDVWGGGPYVGVDMYSVAERLFGAGNLPEHPSEHWEDFNSMDEFLKADRAWQDYVWGGQRPSMVDILMSDQGLYDKAINGELDDMELQVINRELPIYIAEYGLDVSSQEELDLLAKLGYYDVGGGYGYGGYYGGYTYPKYSYGGGTPSYGGVRSMPSLNNYKTYLSLTSWSI